MIEFDIPPFLIYFLGAALVPLLGKGKVRKIFLVALAVFGLVCVALIRPQTGWVLPIFSGLELTLLQADRLSLIMGYIFALAGGGAIIYGISTIKEAGQYVCGLLYMGSAIGAVFAGDFFTLFIFCEIMSFSSLGLIWYERTRRSINAGMRYILYHIFAGCAILAGILIHYTSSGGSITVGPIEPGIGYFLLLLGIGVNAAFIPLHTWVP
ncbi:MAG: Na(+)/H(+) antiporter subunit D, partial [Thermotogae bacterium]